MDSSRNFAISIFIATLLVGEVVYPIAGAALPKDLSPLAWLKYHALRISNAAHGRVQRQVDVDDSPGPDDGPSVDQIDSATQAVAVDVPSSTAVSPDNSSTPERDGSSIASVTELTKSMTEAVTDSPSTLAAMWRDRFPINTRLRPDEYRTYNKFANQLDLTNIEQWVAEQCVILLSAIDQCPQQCVVNLEHPDCRSCKEYCLPERRRNVTQPYFDEWELFMLVLAVLM
ncbi:uncharacterized protein LOC135815328 isoform X2 [Sycon ciliatum]|uniref:uncharacterized protein LOC135815328 isoform X2 n=1 Tax=Sycon ciliatum TaxID=27933 RepID=UPI0031F68494